MSKPDTYIDGAGRVHCSTCGEERKGMELREGGYCRCNNYEIRSLRVKLGSPFPTLGDEIEVTTTTGAELKIRILDFRAIRWRISVGKTPSVAVDIGCRVKDVIKSGKPKLKLVKQSSLLGGVRER